MTKFLAVIVFIIWPVQTLLAQAKDIYTVAFYNVENLFDTVDNPLKYDEEFTPAGVYKYSGKIYYRKLQNIAKVIADLGKRADADGADIIGLAEVENDKVLEDLIAQPAIRNRKYKYVWYDSPDERGIDVALLYNPARFRLLYSRPVLIPLLGDSTRNVLFATGILASDTVHILINHWPSRREGKEKTQPNRLRAATANRQIVDSLLGHNPKARILIMGDLNDNPDDMSITGRLQATGDTNNLLPGKLYNPWLKIYKSGNGTLLYKKHWDLFDHIILSAAFLAEDGLSFSGDEIFKKDYLFTQSGKFKGYPHRSFAGPRWLYGYSDHLPVLIYLSDTNN